MNNQLISVRTLLNGDIAQALAVRQLGERHHEIVVETPELLDIPFALVAGHIPPEGMEWEIIHDLRKHELACIHHSPPQKSKGGECRS